jgi:hypothetical protein
VVPTYNFQHCGHVEDAIEQTHTGFGMAAHLRPFMLVQRGRFAEDLLGNVELADVVEQRAQLDVAELLLSEPQPPGHRDRKPTDGQRMVARVTVPRLQLVRQSRKAPRALADCVVAVRQGLLEPFDRFVHRGGFVPLSGEGALLLPGEERER